MGRQTGNGIKMSSPRQARMVRWLPLSALVANILAFMFVNFGPTIRQSGGNNVGWFAEAGIEGLAVTIGPVVASLLGYLFRRRQLARVLAAAANSLWIFATAPFIVLFLPGLILVIAAAFLASADPRGISSDVR